MMCASGSNMCEQGENVIKTSCLKNSSCHKKKEKKGAARFKERKLVKLKILDHLLRMFTSGKMSVTL